MRYLILLASTLMTFGIAQAEIYQWTDKNGAVHFTDNQDKIPAGYRNRAKEVDLTPSAEEKEPQANSSNSNVDNSSYGGHDEKWWRNRFQSIRDEIKKIQDNLPAKKERLRELQRVRILFHRMADRFEINDLTTEINKDEEQIKTLQKKLADLDIEASKHAVPLEWRK